MASFTPLEIGDDYAASLARDMDEVEYVRLHGLVKPWPGLAPPSTRL